jgi:hypothetical protein
MPADMSSLTATPSISFVRAAVAENGQKKGVKRALSAPAMVSMKSA